MCLMRTMWPLSMALFSRPKRINKCSRYKPIKATNNNKLLHVMHKIRLFHFEAPINCCCHGLLGSLFPRPSSHFPQMSHELQTNTGQSVMPVVVAIGWTHSKVKTIEKKPYEQLHTQTRMWKTTRNQLWLDLYLHRMRRMYIYLLEKSNGFETRI